MSNWDAQTAEWYAEKYGDYPTNKLGVSGLPLRTDATIVDIGCGTGSALRHAAEQVTAGTLIGIDPVPRMVEIAVQQTAMHPAVARIRFYQGAADALPVAEQSADVVLAFDSFDHWPDPLAGLSEVRRILKPGGRFVVVKDNGLPGGSAATTAFEQVLIQAGFSIADEQGLQEGKVFCTRWICTLAG